jgi:hypothetical protein
MNFAAYRALPGVNASSLKAMARSPLHYRYGLDHDRPDTPAMAKGRAVHTACLEPDELPRLYTVWEHARRGKDWAEFAAVNADKQILTSDEYDDVLACRDAVRGHPVAWRYLRNGFAEQTITWDDPDVGPCKARIDFIDTGANTIVDLKTSRDISDRSFQRTTHDLLYHVQAAHYVAGMRAVTDEDWSFVFIAVESNPPHDVRVGPLTEDALYAGEQERRRLLIRVRECTASGEWPGAYPSESDFDLPGWYYAAGEAVMEATL